MKPKALSLKRDRPPDPNANVVTTVGSPSGAHDLRVRLATGVTSGVQQISRNAQGRGDLLAGGLARLRSLLLLGIGGLADANSISTFFFLEIGPDTYVRGPPRSFAIRSRTLSGLGVWRLCLLPDIANYLVVYRRFLNQFSGFFSGTD